MALDYTMIQILVEKTLGGDEQALEQLYLELYHPLHKTALQLVKDSHEAEDMVQEAFTIIFSKLDKVPSTQYFLPWCKRILTNYCLRYMEKPHDMPFDNLEVYLENKESVHKDPLAGILDKERKHLLLSKIDEIDPILSATLELRYYDNYKMSEIALIMDCPEGTVKSRLNRAKRVARDVLNEDKSLSLGLGFLLPASLLIPKTSVKASSLSTPVIYTTVGVVALVSGGVVTTGIQYYAESQPTLAPEPINTITESDTTFPTLLDYNIAEELLVIKMEDKESGIDYSNIYGITDSDTLIKPVKLDTIDGIIYFNIPDENFILYVSDNTGNVSHTQLRFSN